MLDDTFQDCLGKDSAWFLFVILSCHFSTDKKNVALTVYFSFLFYNYVMEDINGVHVCVWTALGLELHTPYA